MKHIYLIIDRANTEDYGIGTYIRQIKQCLKVSPLLSVTIVESDNSIDEVTESQTNGFNHLRFPLHYKALYHKAEDYYMAVAYKLCSTICENDMNIFCFNYLQQYALAAKIKELSPRSVIWVTVHFVNWMFALKGNIGKMHTILNEHYQENSFVLFVLKDYMDSGKMLRLANRVIFLSAYTQKVLSQEYELNKHDSVVIPNGMEDNGVILNKRQKERVKKSLGLPKHEKIILYAGRLVEEKGLGYLIKAFRMLLKKNPDCRLVIAGDGDLSKYIYESRYCSKITFVGKLPHKELYLLYQIADIGVLPSLMERCSYTVIEMLMFGLPIIGTTTPGISEMIEDGVHGYKVKIRKRIDGTPFLKETEIVNALLNILACGQKERMAKNCRERYEKRYRLAYMRDRINLLL